jgi:hypothetical protein
MHLFSLLFVLLLPLVCFSYDITLQDKTITKLSKEKTWLKLLHYDIDKKRSSINSEDFFLSKDGKKNPKKELLATIQNYQDVKDQNSSAVCKFPARYMWLSKQINLPNYEMINHSCTKLQKWYNSKHVKSISLLFVSGYLGNPASTFGHSFLKLNQEDETRSDLFDLSVSYGALVPNQENGFVYIFKGITGGYDAGFTDKYFYTQDLVYSHTEFRDIWDYKLNLSQDEKEFLLLHIWELIGKKFQYFFTHRNCGYEVSKLLELVIDEPLVKDADVWFAPVETFHRFNEIDKKREKKLIEKITYIPSEQQLIYNHFKILSKEEKAIASRMIQQDKQSLKDTKLSETQKIHITDFILAYYKYMLVKERDNNQTIQKKNKILLQRLQLPQQKKQNIPIEKRASPHLDNKPRSLSLSLSHSQEYNNYLSFRFIPFGIEAIGQNTLRGNALSILDTTIGIKDKEIFIDKLDFIKVDNYKTMQLPFQDENPWSWQLQVGLKNIDKSYDMFAKSGIGRAYRKNNLLLFALINGSIHSKNQTFRIQPHIGMHLDFGKLKLYSFVGVENCIKEDKFDPIYHIESGYKVNKELAITVNYNKDETEKSSLGVQYFF